MIRSVSQSTSVAELGIDPWAGLSVKCASCSIYVSQELRPLSARGLPARGSGQRLQAGGCRSPERSEGGASERDRLCTELRCQSLPRSGRPGGSQPGTFLSAAGRSSRCAGVSRTLLISQCWDGVSWASRSCEPSGEQPRGAGGAAAAAGRVSPCASPSLACPGEAEVEVEAAAAAAAAAEQGELRPVGCSTPPGRSRRRRLPA